MSKRISKGATKGYTLIEMLVVLAIIMVLAGIMLPASLASYRKARLSQALAYVQGALEEARSRSASSGERYAVVFCNAECQIDRDNNGTLDGTDKRHWCAVVKLSPGSSVPELEDIDNDGDRIYLPDGVSFKALTYKDSSSRLWKDNWDEDFSTISSDAVQTSGLNMVIFNPLDPEGLVSFYPSGLASSHTPPQQYIALQLSDDRASYLLLKIKENSGEVSTVLE